MADNNKVKTMQLSGNDYAKVADRLLKFREDFSKSKIETSRINNDDGSVEFEAYIWKDKTDLIDLMKSGVTDKEVLRSSADANGSAKGEVGKKVKDFEKLETIAIGRALAVIGYAGSGDIASFEEMDEFNDYQNEKKAKAISEAIVSFSKAKSLDELRQAFMDSGMMQEPAIVAAKNTRKDEITDALTKIARDSKEPGNADT